MYNHRKQLLNAIQIFIHVMLYLHNLVFMSVVCSMSAEAVANLPLSLVEKLF